MYRKKQNLPVIHIDLCTGCGACAAICPTAAIALQGEDPYLKAPEKCTCCAECEEICPVNAISVPFTIGWAEK
jgi:ferredoxin